MRSTKVDLKWGRREGCAMRTQNVFGRWVCNFAGGRVGGRCNNRHISRLFCPWFNCHLRGTAIQSSSLEGYCDFSPGKTSPGKWPEDKERNSEFHQQSDPLNLVFFKKRRIPAKRGFQVNGYCTTNALSRISVCFSYYLMHKPCRPQEATQSIGRRWNFWDIICSYFKVPRRSHVCGRFYLYRAPHLPCQRNEQQWSTWSCPGAPCSDRYHWDDCAASLNSQESEKQIIVKILIIRQQEKMPQEKYNKKTL